MELVNAFAGNQFMAGGFVLMLLGAILAYCRHLPSKIYRFFERFFILKIEIQDEDESYQWMQVWLAERLKHALSISVVTKRKSEMPTYDEEFATKAKPQIYFVPAVGTYFFWYKRRLVTLNRSRQEAQATNILQSADKGGRQKETFTFSVFSRNKEIARQLIEEAREMAVPEDGKLEIRVASWSQWRTGTRIKPRTMDSVILDDNQVFELAKDIREFLDTRAWYENVGVPYRRSYLFYGEPGNGKSSAAKAIAGHFGMNIYLLVLSDPEMNDSKINDLLSAVPEGNIVLLEDIDCAFDKRNREGKQGLTFSGLLNAIDGVASGEGRILMMTTNHLDRLDKALIRPGRADVKINFGNATKKQTEILYNRFFPGQEALAEEFGKTIPDRKYSMATIQDYLMLYKNQPNLAVYDAPKIEALQASMTPLPSEPPSPDDIESSSETLED